jgi:hypothetical protein
MFLHLLTMAVHAPAHKSANKASFLVMRDLADARLHSGRKAPSSKQTAWTAWTAFRPAAHLWAAFNLCLDDLEAALARGDLVAMALLPLAEALRRLAEDRGIFTPGELWRAPATIQVAAVDVMVPPPTVWTLEQLSEYRAR